MNILDEILAQNAEIIALLKGGAAAAPAAETTTKTETAAQKKAREAKEAAAAPTYTAEQVRDMFLAVQDKHGSEPTKELIAECGYDKLAKLVADIPGLAKNYAAAEAKLAEDVAGDDNGGL